MNENESSDDDSDCCDFFEAEKLSSKITHAWEHQKRATVSDFSVAAWITSVHPDIQKDIKNRLSG